MKIPEFSIKSFGLGLYLFEIIMNPDHVDHELHMTYGWNILDVQEAAKLLSMEVCELDIDRLDSRRVLIAVKEGLEPCFLELKQFEDELENIWILAYDKKILIQRIELLKKFNNH